MNVSPPVRSSVKVCGIAIVLYLLSVPAEAETTGKIAGKVVDKMTNDVLPGVNVVVEGTSLGAATDLYGNFTIPLVSPGLHSVKASCIGYKPVVDSTVQVNDGQTTTITFTLEAVAFESKGVIVTAQASGQDRAINQQLSSVQITNVVSAARIQELPDANAAESVGRLPGVSLLRNGGEGTQIVIRGLEPKYNAITVDGVRMATSASFDRSADLSMISPYSLENIEIIKSPTPDLDPDVLGGTVNFKLREARGEKPGVGLNFLAQGGYTGLSDAYNKYNNYKYVGSVEGRFLESKLGIFAQGDVERRNLSSNEFGGSYDHLGNSQIDYIVSGLNLNDVLRDRRRSNGTLVMDYKLPEGKISLSNFFSSGITDVYNRGESFIPGSNLHKFSLGYSNSTLNNITNALSFEHQLPLFRANVKLSHSYAETKTPGDWTVEFQSNDQNLGQFGPPRRNVDPRSIPPAALNAPDSTFLNTLVTNNSFSKERALSVSLDLDAPVSLSELITGVIKFGGKYRHQTRLYDYDQTGGQGYGLVSARFADSLIESHFGLGTQYDTKIPLTPFMDPGFSYGTFLNGDFPMALPLNAGMMSDFANFMKSNAALFAQRGDLAFFQDYANSTTFDYGGNENQSAFYAMATANIGPSLTIVGGVRYQDLKTTYTASRGVQNTASQTGGPYFHYDTTLTVDHAYWLPDVILRVKPLSWFDVRLSYSNTLAYPDYRAIIPRIDVSVGSVISWNNAQLDPTRSANYDGYVSFYDNSIGLFTMGGFLKRIDRLIYPQTLIVQDSGAKPYYPPGLVGSAPFRGQYTINTYINDPVRIDNYGMELDWQTHFWYLPHPLDGLVLNINYTHVFSNSDYPYVIYLRADRFSPTVAVDTTYRAPLLYQPNKILNLSVGYDYLGFSMRLSMLYQADIFTGIPVGTSPGWLQLHTSTSSSTRWDMSVKQDLPAPLLGIQLYGDLNNLSKTTDVSVIHAPTGVPASEQLYGLTGDLGVRWRF